jgi:UPF0042 nucleotide-binding protein
MLKKIVSFGYRHEWPPEAGPGEVVIDVRTLFKNPYHDRKLRYLRGTDAQVQVEILKNPMFNVRYAYVKEQVTVPGVEVAYIGCTGGHHRSVFLAEKLGQELGVSVEHRDIEKP